jgi:hypothetical protein
MIPVNDFMPAALADLLRKAPMSDDKLQFAWRQAVGPPVERVSSIQLDGRVLRVRVDDQRWRKEIQRSEALIRERLAALLGDVVRKIVVS